jgi:hypothetical protein
MCEFQISDWWQGFFFGSGAMAGLIIFVTMIVKEFTAGIGPAGDP